MVAAHRVISVVGPDSAPIKRLIQDARDAGRVIDVSCGRRTRSVIFTDSDHIVRNQAGNHLHPSERSGGAGGRRRKRRRGLTERSATMKKRGLLFIISGPAGSGKGTIVKRVRELAEFDFSVSATTRAPRPGEIDGVHYFFTDKEEFRRKIAAGEMLEHAEYVGNYYGTPKKPVDDALSAGKNIILDIDVQGALQVKTKMPEAVMIFVLPPDFETLMRRIRASSGAHETILSDTEQAGAYFLDLFLGEREEKLYEACLDAKGRLLACHLVAEGDTESVQLNMRKIVENALKCGASSVLLAHNHPSGVALPSPADNATTLSVFDALRTVGVELADHIIVADDDFVSLRHNGLLPERKGNGYGI